MYFSTAKANWYDGYDWVRAGSVQETVTMSFDLLLPKRVYKGEVAGIVENVIKVERESIRKALEKRLLGASC